MLEKIKFKLSQAVNFIKKHPVGATLIAIGVAIFII